MLPLEVPAGTSPRDLLTKVLPEAHRALVHGDGERYVLGVRIDGPDPLAFTYVIQGSRVEVEERQGPAHLWIASRGATLERFLADWTGPRRFMPKFVPTAPPAKPGEAPQVALLTDPRVLKRLVLVKGRIELALPDLDGERASMVAGAGGGKTIEIDDEDPDVVVESSVPVFEKLLAGSLGPDEALGGGHVDVRGKKLVAMQFAFALAPFFPAPKPGAKA